MKLIAKFTKRSNTKPATTAKRSQRREHYRMQCQFDFAGQAGKHEFSLTCTDLSGTGMRALCIGAVPSEFQCHLPTPGGPIVTSAVIVRAEPGVLALRFEHPDTLVEDRLMRHVLDLQRAEIRRRRLMPARALTTSEVEQALTLPNAPAQPREIRALRELVSNDLSDRKAFLTG